MNPAAPLAHVKNTLALVTVKAEQQRDAEYFQQYEEQPVIMAEEKVNQMPHRIKNEKRSTFLRAMPVPLLR